MRVAHPPCLPHDALKYIPEFRHDGNAAADNKENTTEETTEGSDTGMKTEQTGNHSYFSPDSIRSRYAEHIQNETAVCNDPLLDVAGIQ